MKNQHVHFKTMPDSIDTKTPVGRFFFHVMASLAMEQELIVERTRAVAGSRDRTLRVWVAERRGDYHLHRRGSYLQLFRATAWKTREGPFP
jgi:DNA invertase Pin-like site-specific DNA recombinase